jgi:hypothetical protein
MATFLDDLSIYNAKAASAITLAIAAGDSTRANLMSSLRSTANDTSLTEDVRLNALTALINVGDLLDIPLPPYFPITTTFANSQTYVGLHNDLSGLNVEPYLHLTTAEKSFFSNKANLGDISFANLLGEYTLNTGLRDAINGKQNALNGTGLVRANGGSITYDSSIYITSISGISATGDLDGQYPNPTLRNTSVTGQLLTGFDISAPTGTVTGSNTILSAIETLNANVNNVIATSGTITSVLLTLPSSVFVYGTTPVTSGPANLSGSFKNQNQNSFFAGPASGGAFTPAFRAIEAADFPVVPGLTATTYGSAISIPQIAVDVYGRVTAITNVTAAGGGRVDTITYNVPSLVFTTAVVQGTNATITLGLQPQPPNTVWAGPDSGTIDVAPGFRSLVVADIPTLPLSKIPEIDGQLGLKLGDSLNVNLIFMGNASTKAVQTRVGGDLTASFSASTGSNVGTFTIANQAVTYSKFQFVPNNVLNETRPILLGRFDITQGEIQELTLDPTAFVLNDEFGTIGLLSPNPPSLEDVGDLLTSTGDNNLVRLPVGASGSLLMPYNSGIDPNPGLIWGNVQGDISYTVDSTTTPGTPFGAFSIGANKVTLGKIQQIGINTILGNITANPDDVSALTVTQVTAMLEQFNTTRQGVVPAASFAVAPGKFLSDYFLNANGAWSLGGGGSGSGTVSPGTIYQLAYYPADGDTVDGLGVGTAGYFLKSGGSVAAPSWQAVTGTGDVVLANNPTLTGTPVLSTATATSINGLTISTTTGTLTLDNGSTLVTSGAFSTTLTATATTTLTLPTTGTLATLAGTETFTNKTLNGPKIGTVGGQGHFHMHSTNSVPTGLTNYITVFGDKSPNKKVGFLFELDGFESYFQFNATTASKTYTFPDATGTVALINASNILSVPKDGSTSGALALGGGTTGTITLQAPASVTGTGTYTLPDAYPAAASGYYLTSNLLGALNWVAVTGGGDVVGPIGPVADGDFVVFDGTSGKLIAEPTTASFNNTTGQATFNGGVNVGVDNASTGTIVFRNNSNAFTTTIQASNSASASANYTWPTAPAASAGLILANDGSGNLSWTSAGTGNVTLAGTQTFTGVNTFNAGSIRINNAGNTFYTLLATNVAGANKTITFPDSTGLVALQNASNSFSGTNTFTAAQTFNIGYLRIASSGSYVTLASESDSNSRIVNFPNTTAVTTANVAYSNFGQNFSVANTFSATQTFNNNCIRISGSVSSVLLTTASDGNSKTVNFPNFGSGVVTANVAYANYGQTFSAANSFSALQTFTAGLTVSSGAATFSGGATFQTATATFNSGILRFGNSGNTFFYTIAGSAITAGRQLTLPLLAANDTFAVLGLGQTFTGAQKFSGALSVIEANASMGLATLAANAGGSFITVNTARVTATSRIYLTVQTAGGTQGLLRISARNAGTNFTITSLSATETSTVAWLIIEPT